MAFGRGQSQLVKSHHLTTCLQDPAAGTISESQSTDLFENNFKKKRNQNLATELHSGKKINSYLELRDVLKPDVISDSSDNNSGFVLAASQLHLTDLIAKRRKLRNASYILGDTKDSEEAHNFNFFY